MTALEFLEEQGIDLNQTALVCVIDGYMRQPDLCSLMELYAEVKVKEKEGEC